MIFLSVFLLGFALSTSANLSYKNDFEAFERKFDKKYETPEERLNRFNIFQNNVKEIEAFNEGSHSWKKGINQFTDMTKDEFKARVNGYINTPKPTGNGISAKNSFDLEQLPDSVDWRDRGAISSVKDQGACGSCWAFSAVHAIESYLQINSNKSIEDLSPQQITSCTPNTLTCGGGGGCEGAVVPLAWSYTERFGLVRDADYPYDSGNMGDSGSCEMGTDNGPSPNDAIATLRGYENLPANDYLSVMHHLANVGPLAVSVAASGWSFYSGGIFDGCDYNQNIELNHAVQLVGYGTDPQEGDYWLVRNSWSEYWGEDGFIRLRREADPQCGTDSTPLNGGGCIGDGKDILTVCGQCGIIFDTSYPIGVSYIEQ